jgi:hypothetical protein
MLSTVAATLGIYVADCFFYQFRIPTGLEISGQLSFLVGNAPPVCMRSGVMALVHAQLALAS